MSQVNTNYRAKLLQQLADVQSGTGKTVTGMSDFFQLYAGRMQEAMAKQEAALQERQQELLQEMTEKRSSLSLTDADPFGLNATPEETEERQQTQKLAKLADMLETAHIRARKQQQKRDQKKADARYHLEQQLTDAEITRRQMERRARNGWIL